MASNNSNLLHLNNTAKFAVLDFKGITQPTENLNQEQKETDETPDCMKVEKSKSAAKSKSKNNKRATGPTQHTLDGKGSLIGKIQPQDFTKEANPGWLNERLKRYEEIAEQRASEFEKKQRKEVIVTLPDGKEVKAVAWETSPYDVAKGISQGLADGSCVAKLVYSRYVEDYDALECGDTRADLFMGEEEHEDESNQGKNEILWDLTRPIVGDCSMQFIKFSGNGDNEDPIGRTVFWHSSAHMLGEALEHIMGANLTIGPPLNGGFYYDAWIGSEVYTESMYKEVESEITKIIKKKQKFERLIVTKEEALDLFSYNPFKLEIIRTKVPENSRTTVYKCGDLIDLCQGPHVRTTGQVKAFSIAKHSATNWLGDTSLPTLQRMYGIAFPDKKMLKAWKENQALAKARDHRLIGKKQELFFFHDLSPGSAFFLPHGTRIYNTLVNFIKEHYWNKGYTEIMTPNVFNLDLWHTSGHAMHYKDAMFTFDVEGAEWGMKPMNCPAHCLIFGHKIRSHRDLPLRLADFGVLHRNELSGALTGLTRVRRFVQDDAHIFCTPGQIESEVLAALHFMKEVYDVFGMSYKLELSTRPAKALGEIALWTMAEAALAKAMDNFIGEGNWRVNPGDGAFYGPKIDIKVMDAMQRVHQCATIQLDFQLPIRFDLSYQTGAPKDPETGVVPKERPVMVHRAMLGSVERMFAVLCEHYGGKWPLWLSPRQIMLIPVHKDWIPYCEELCAMLRKEKFYVDVSSGRETFQKKVRNAQLAQYNYQLVIGEAESKNRSVNVRTRANKVQGEMKIEDFMEKVLKEREEKVR